MTCAPYAAVVRRRASRARCARSVSSLARGRLGVEASSSSSETANAVSAVPRSRFVGTRARAAANARGFDVAVRQRRACARRAVCRRTRFEWCFGASLDETRGARRPSEERYAVVGRGWVSRRAALQQGPSSATPDGPYERERSKMCARRSAARVAVALACGAMRSGITPEEIEERMERARESRRRRVRLGITLPVGSEDPATIADDDHQRRAVVIPTPRCSINRSSRTRR